MYAPGKTYDDCDYTRFFGKAYERRKPLTRRSREGQTEYAGSLETTRCV